MNFVISNLSIKNSNISLSFILSKNKKVEQYKKKPHKHNV